MREVTVTVSAQDVSAPIPLDNYVPTFNVSVGVQLGGGTLTYKLQYTYDNIFASGFTPGTAKWWDDATMTGKTADFDKVLTAPVRAIRLNVTAYTSGTATMQVVQQGTQ